MAKHFVLRATNNPAADLARGWSAWGGEYAKNPLHLGEVDCILCEIDNVPDFETADEAMEWINDETKAYVKKCPSTGMYAAYHHDGLSCYELDAETLEEALEVAKTEMHRHNFFNGGETGINPIAYHHVVDNIYVFEVEEVGAQSDS